MAKKAKFEIPEEEKILWRDRKRILGMPISFTRYEVSSSRLILRVGFFKTVTQEILLYRILDIKLERTLGQKLLGVGTVILYSADQTNPTLELKNIKKSDAVRTFLSRQIEQQRDAKRITGREMYGAAVLDTDGPFDAATVESEFVDIDNDGIPD